MSFAEPLSQMTRAQSLRQQVPKLYFLLPRLESNPGIHPVCESQAKTIRTWSGQFLEIGIDSYKDKIILFPKLRTQ